VLVLNTQNVENFGFVTLDIITRKNSLYWILNVEIYLDAMDIGIPFNKEIKHPSNMTKILWKEISQILWIYFMLMYGWLDKAIKLLMKNHEIRLICSIPISECSNKYYEFISCLCMAEQNNELLIENQETCPNWFCSIPRSECRNIWFIFSWSWSWYWIWTWL